MKVFGDLLFELYRLTQNAPPEEFQRLAMEKLQKVFDFDSAFWATGVVHAGVSITAHTHYLYRQPPEMMENWARINQNDELAFAAFRQQGLTLNSALCGAEWQSRFGPEAREHIERYGMAHVLTTIIAEPLSQIWSGVSFYRADPGRPFSEEQRLLKQHLMPHLAAAWDISRFAYISSFRQHGTQPGHGQAICDSKGVLYNTDRNFTALLLAEWPQWRGPQLPPELLERLSANHARRYAGRHTVVSFEALNNMELLNARKISAIDQLSAREFEVAALFATGANYQTIADALHIAPVTVRNHLSNIYTKLGIKNKMELAQLMHGD